MALLHLGTAGSIKLISSLMYALYKTSIKYWLELVLRWNKVGNPVTESWWACCFCWFQAMSVIGDRRSREQKAKQERWEVTHSDMWWSKLRDVEHQMWPEVQTWWLLHRFAPCREKELAKVTIKKEDVELIVSSTLFSCLLFYLKSDALRCHALLLPGRCRRWRSRGPWQSAVWGNTWGTWWKLWWLWPTERGRCSHSGLLHFIMTTHVNWTLWWNVLSPNPLPPPFFNF